MVGTLVKSPFKAIKTITSVLGTILMVLMALMGWGRTPEGSRSPMNTSFSSRSWSRTSSRSSCSTRSTRSSTKRRRAPRRRDPARARPARRASPPDGTSRRSPIVHLNRRSDTDVLNRITGSGGYGGSARSILTFGRHPENDEQRVVAAEGNWQKEAHSDLFELREIVVFPDADPEDQTQPALVHIGVTRARLERPRSTS